MNKPFLFFLGIALGGAAGYFAPHTADKTTPVELTQAKTEIARLQTQLAASEAAISKKNTDKTTAATEPATDGKPDIKKLMEDAKPLLKSLTSGFEPRRKEMMKRMIDEQLKRMTAMANLTPEQQAAFRSYLEQLSTDEQAKWQNALDGKGGFEQLFQNGRGGPNQSKAMDEWAQQNLTGDQATAYQTTRLTEKAKQVTDSANAKLDSINSLNLNETQKDQVFHILVQTDKNYDPAMKLEGAGNETPVTGTKDEAIAAVLSPTQREQYEKQQQQKQQRAGGFFKALGMDPSRQPANPK